MRPLATIALVLVPLAGCAAPTAAAAWTWPVRGPVLARFHYRPDRPFDRGQHRGIDVAAERGAPVVAACRGRVRFAGAVGTSGRTVSTTCGPYVVSYLHLDAIATRRGARLAAGDGVGTVGTTGRRRERRPHLSFGVRRAADRWGYVDPLRLLPGGDTAPPELVPLARRPGAPSRLGPVRAPAAPRLGPRAEAAPGHRSARIREAGRAAAAGASAHALGTFGLPFGALWLPAGAVLALGALGAPLVHRTNRRMRAGRRSSPPTAEGPTRFAALRHPVEA